MIKITVSKENKCKLHIEGFIETPKMRDLLYQSLTSYDINLLNLEEFTGKNLEQLNVLISEGVKSIEIPKQINFLEYKNTVDIDGLLSDNELEVSKQYFKDNAI